MKRLIGLIFISALLLISVEARAFLSQRLQWWKVHSARLDQEQERTAKNRSIDPAVTELLKKQQDGAREILSVFDRALGGTANLTQIKKTFSAEELSEITKATTEPLLNLALLELLVNQSGDRKNIAAVQTLFTKHLAALSLQAGSAAPAHSCGIITRSISPEEWKIITAEHYLCSILEHGDDVLREIQNAVNASLAEEMNKIGKTTRSRIESMAISETLSLLAQKIPPEIETEPVATTNTSWYWKKITGDLNNFVTAKNELDALMPDEGKKTCAPVNPLTAVVELERLIFDRRQKDILQHAKSTFPAQSESDYHSIPTESNIESLLLKINTMRKSRTGSITGRETQDFFDDFRKDLDTAIDAKFSYVKKYLEEEKKTLLPQNAQAGHDSDAVKENAGKCLLALEYVSAVEKQVRDYADASYSFAEWLYRKTQRENIHIASTYRYGIEKNGQYVALLQKIIGGCSDMAAWENEKLHSRYSVAVNRSSNLVRFIDSALSPDMESLRALSAKEIRECRTLKHEFHLAAQNSLVEINRLHQDYIKRKSQASTLMRNSATDLKEKIAQVEIDHFCATAQQFADAYDRFHYDEDALSSYRETYTRLRAVAAKGTEDPDLNRALITRTLIPLCADFDEKKFILERNTKKFIQKECEIALARISTMLKFYRRQGISIEISPLQEEIDSIKSIISRKRAATIASWKMNEFNYHEVDAKACQELARIARYAAFKKSKDSPEKEKPNRTVTVPGSEISFHLPGSWVETEPGQVDSIKGMVAAYSNSLLGSSIEVSLVTDDHKNAQEISAEWIRKEGMRLIRGKWINKDGLYYYWGLAKEGKMKIIETYAAKHNSKVIIITGETTRDRYAEFSRALGHMINSLEF
ncbi:MAG TPA: hypothetical protein PK926_01910 [Spirochaetota bacterium]|nr:hypothetical protein [Spirochaetota bacterium]HPI90208.1 hypothetical protein [Spirochaetota bacterium]HPR46528.1 hypothetical protein [Spirochaetota bacterium]